MAIACEDFVIDVSKEQSFRYLLAKQYDHLSRKRRLIITDSNVPITYSEDRHEYIVLSMSINGNNYSNTVCKFESDKYPYIIFEDSMLSVAGEVECEIRIYDYEAGNILTTFSFKINISKSIMNHDRLIESSEFNVLNNLILQALNIPDLIKEFNLSQEQINTLIVEITDDISINRSNFSTLSSEAQSLINDIQTFLAIVNVSETERINAEKNRVIAEEKRETDSAIAIRNAESAISNVIEATDNAKNATQSTIQVIEEAQISTLGANVARDRCLAAIEGLHYEIVDVDGGTAVTGEDDYNNDYNGGGA